MNELIPSRITEAREARALSMADLAERIGKTRQSISKYEQGINKPSPEVLWAISEILSFPVDFFYKSELNISSRSSSLFFRSRSSILKKTKTACKYQIKWVNETKRLLEKYVVFLDKHIPMIDIDFEDLSPEDIEEIALNMRNDWNLGDAPIKDLIGLLENNGVIISQFSPNKYCDFKGIDAFSAWQDGTPYILCHALVKSAVRTRFSILHELGHLIFHSAISEKDSVTKSVVDLADMQADRFAAAFLMPATSFPNDIRGTSLSSLEIVKRKWGAAMSTIIKRCETLNVLTESQIDYLKRQMTTKKYWRKEPLDDVLTINGPEVLRDAVLLIIERDILTRDQFLNKVALPIKDVKSICRLPDEFFSGYNDRQKPALRLIK